MSKTTQQGLTAILPLFLVIFIDGLSLGIIFPILTPVYMDPNGILPVATSLHVREILYGITMATFPIGMFLGTPWLGDLSDQIGRKKVLLACLVMVAVSYLFSAIAIAISSVIFLIFSRFIAGLFAGSEAIAQAAVIDICPPDKKASYLSLLLLPVTLGFIAGPLFSSYLSDPKLVHWFTFWVPLLLAAAVASINALFLWFGFKETYVEHHGKMSFKLSKAIAIFVDAFIDRRIRVLSVIFLGLQIGFGAYFQFVPLYLNQEFHYSNYQIGYFVATIGAGFAFGFTYGIRTILKYLNHKQALFTTLIAIFIGLATTAFATNPIYLWFAIPLIATGMSIAYSVSIALYSDLVGEEHQGWIMGVSNAIAALAWGITALAISLVSTFGSLHFMFYGGVLSILMSIIVTLYNRRAPSKKAVS